MTAEEEAELKQELVAGHTPFGEMNPLAEAVVGSLEESASVFFSPSGKRKLQGQRTRFQFSVLGEGEHRPRFPGFYRRNSCEESQDGWHWHTPATPETSAERLQNKAGDTPGAKDGDEHYEDDDEVLVAAATTRERLRRSMQSVSAMHIVQESASLESSRLQNEAS